MDTRDYVADRREYDGRGRRVRHSGGWAILRWDKSRSTWLEPVSYYPTKGAALDVLRDERERSKAASALGRRGGLAGRGESQRRPGMTSEHMRAVRARRVTVSMATALETARPVAAGRADVSPHYGIDRRRDRAIQISGCYPEVAEAVGREIERALGLSDALRVAAGFVAIWLPK